METKKEIEQGIMLIDKALDLLQNKPVGKKLLEWSEGESNNGYEDWYSIGIGGLYETRVKLKNMLKKYN
jgi:hypothetical protein